MENRMGNKLEELELSIKHLEDAENSFHNTEQMCKKDSIVQNKSEKAELEALLREFLA